MGDSRSVDGGGIGGDGHSGAGDGRSGARDGHDGAGDKDKDEDGRRRQGLNEDERPVARARRR